MDKKDKIIDNEINKNNASKELLAYKELIKTAIKKIQNHQYKPLFYLIKSVLKHNEIIEKLYPDISKFSLYKIFYWDLENSKWEGLKYYKYLYEEGILQESHLNATLQFYIIQMLRKFLHNPNLPSYANMIHRFKWYNNMQWWGEAGVLIYYDKDFYVFYHPITNKLKEIEKGSLSLRKFHIVKSVNVQKYLKENNEKGGENDREETDI